MVVRYRSYQGVYTFEKFSEKCFFDDTDYGFTVCPKCKKTRSTKKDKTCLACENEETNEVKFLLDMIEKCKDIIFNGGITPLRHLTERTQIVGIVMKK